MPRVAMLGAFSGFSRPYAPRTYSGWSPPGCHAEGVRRDGCVQSTTASWTGAHIALIGVLTGFAGEMLIPALFSNQIRISGISVGSRADQEDMIRAITANRLTPVIDRRFPLQEIIAAFKIYESQKHFGKVCLDR